MTDTTLNRLEGVFIAFGIIWFTASILSYKSEQATEKYNQGYIKGRTDAFSEAYHCYGLRGLDYRIMVSSNYPCEE